MTAVGKIVVVGASGLVGAKVVDILRANGLEVLPASRRTGTCNPALWSPTTTRPGR